jgi:GNAT superfamily N-acetyltransferase
MNGLEIRRAEMSDIPAIRDMQERSFFTLGAAFYPRVVLEAFQSRASTMDDAVVAEGHTFVTVNVVGAIVGSAAWSRRVPGYDAVGGIAVEAGATHRATIRSVFVDPRWARCGIGTALMQHVEDDALQHGVRYLEMKATLSGVDFYRARGYRPGAAGNINLGDGFSFAYVPMEKAIGIPARRCGAASPLSDEPALEAAS